MSMDFEILEANESMEESTVIGEQSSYREKHLKMSKQNSGEQYKQDLKAKLLNSKKFNSKEPVNHSLNNEQLAQ